jgi:hypothetical protein
MPLVFEGLSLFYLVIKGVFFIFVVTAFVKSRLIGDHPILTGLFYAAGVTLLSGVFFGSLITDRQAWNRWLIMNAGLSVLYFWLLHKLENTGFPWWFVLCIGCGLVLF